MLSVCLPFEPERDHEIFASVPADAAVFMLRSDDPQAEPYVSKTANLRRRLMRLLGSPEEHSKKLNLRSRAKTIEYSRTGSDFESGFLLYSVLRAHFPKTYSSRLRLRPAALIKMHMENAYPRTSVTRRLGRLDKLADYYGPFASRTAAEKFANDALDFFKMRRCVEDLNPDPAFPGCIYSEMKMCLAPCFKGCTNQEYQVEVERVNAFFNSGGESLVNELAEIRDNASRNLEFENAAALHARIDKLKPVLSQLPEIVHRLDRLSGVMIHRSVQPESVSLFRIDAGAISGPRTFSVQQQLAPGGKSQSMESRVQEVHAAFAPAFPRSAAQLMEHIAILKRWFFRGTRTGEIFFADEKGALPFRRIVRGIARVYRGEKEQSEMAAAPAVQITESSAGYILMKSDPDKSFREQLVQLLQGGHAHATFDDAVDGFPAELRGKKTKDLPYSPWMLLEHMRLAQWDILEFSRDPKHQSPDFPKGYWPPQSEPPSASSWDSSVKSFRADLKAMQGLVNDPKADLHRPFSWGDGQTLFREALLLADHNAYHLGEFVVLRRLLGAWKK